MQFSALKYFIETARLGSIRRAAEVLYVAPSAVSRQIALLEAKFGAPLFERHAGGVRLTPAGEVFASQARSTLRDFERLQSQIDDLQQLRRGLVRIACVEAIVPGLLYDTIREFRKSYPGIEYDLRVLGSLKALMAVAHEECDIGLTFEPGVHADVTEDGALPDPVVAVVPPGHPLGRRRSLTICELAQHRLALLDDAHVTHALVNRAFAAEGLKPHIDVRLSHVGVTTAYVREGLGLTVLPSLAVRADARAGRVRTVAIDDPLFRATRFVLCHPKAREPTLPARAFMAALRLQFAQHAAGAVRPRVARGRRAALR
ncbi:MAG: LysR family transcriptional regulator [Proteobacteria bacterium]|nr:LysR family transcriptional regulator [Pseudomonadota bacterium]